MAIPSVPLFGNPTRVTADVAIKASPGKIWAIQLDGGTDDSSIVFFNDIDSAGTNMEVISIVAPCTTSTTSGRSSVFIDYSPLGGIDFSIGIWANWTGTAAVGYVWFS